MSRTALRGIIFFCLGFSGLGIPMRYGVGLKMTPAAAVFMPWVDASVVLIGVVAAIWYWRKR